MILQDLIRNYITYREVLKPLIESWTELWIVDYPKKLPRTPFYILILASTKAKEAVLEEGESWHLSYFSDQDSIRQTNGTSTISTFEKLPFLYRGLYQLADDRLISASFSNNTYIMLTDTRISEIIVDIGKTHNQTPILFIEKMTSDWQKTVSGTTGYQRKQINFLLNPETHEKREYLGEFSLTHEAINTSSFKEGGDYHESDQKPITAVV